MMRACSVLLVVAGGVAQAQPPGLTPRHAAVSQQAGRLAAAAAFGDVRAVESFFGSRLAYGGMWFPDPACRKKFPAPELLEGDRVQAFAHCLAGLALVVSPRLDGLTDTAVLSYQPGIELEARFFVDDNFKTLRWIGYVARRDDNDVLPTVMPEALEGLRAAGLRNPQLDAATRALLDKELAASGKSYAYAWLKVCIDAKGAVTGAQGRDASSKAAEGAFMAAVHDWTFQPFLLDGTATAVCSMLRLGYPADKLPTEESLPLPPPPPAVAQAMPKNLPPGEVEAQRVKGDKQIAPDGQTMADLKVAGISRIMASFKVCIDETGLVSSVTLLRPSVSKSYNQKLAREIAKWQYRPFLVDGQPAPVCTAVTFIYTQN